MDTKLEKIFKNIGGSNPLDFLQSKILTRIDQEIGKKVMVRNIISRIIGSLSFVAIFPVFINIFTQLQSSGFWNYFSLIFTDTGVVLTYWKELSLSLIESIPLFSIILVLTLILTLSVSIKFSNISFKRNNLSAKLA